MIASDTGPVLLRMNFYPRLSRRDRLPTSANNIDETGLSISTTYQSTSFDMIHTSKRHPNVLLNLGIQPSHFFFRRVLIRDGNCFIRKSL